MKILVSALLVLTFTATSFSVATAREEQEKKGKSILGALYTPDRDQVVGQLLQKTLEAYHLAKKPLNNSLSEKAYKMYLEKVDYGKQFLTKKDVGRIEKFKSDFDDQLKNGGLSIIKVTSEILKSRIPMVKTHVETILKKDFDFKKKEKYETDPKKRTYATNTDELKERWRKLIKMEVLVQYFDLKDEQDGVNQDKKDKKDKKKKKKKVAKKKEKKKTYAELMSESREKVLKRYKKVFARLMEEKRNDQLDKFYNSITRIYDPHTLYLMPEEKEDFDIDMSGKLEGIGALLREEGSYIKVERIIPGSASWKGKELKAEDIILAVGQDDKDPVDIVDMSIRDAVKLIRGPKGTTVKLRVKRPDGTTKTIAIIRDQVVLEESYVKSTIIEHKDLKQKIGYIHVPKFYRDFQNPNGRNCSNDVKVEIEKLKKQGVEGIILNLRNNGGGALEDARLMSGLFIDKGPIVQVKNVGAPQVKSDEDGVTYWDKPLIILVNRFSASASEIVAGAMKDYKRAVIVGSSEQTHGKGTVQAILDLKNFLNPFTVQVLGPIGAMKITTDMFYRVNGMSTQFRGIVPHIVLPDQYGYLDSGEKSLEYAIPYEEIPAQDYKIWKKHKYDISALQEKSEKRVAKNEKFKSIVKSVNWSKERKENTERSINFDEMKKYREDTLKFSDEVKNDSINKKVVIKSTNKLKNDVEKERFKEFQEELQKDPVVEETLMIFSDMLKKS